MSDSSDLMAASFNSVGFNAEVMPTRTPESIAISNDSAVPVELHEVNAIAEIANNNTNSFFILKNFKLSLNRI